MSKITKTMTIGGAERRESAAADAIRQGAVEGAGPAAVQADKKAELLADERSDARKADLADEKKDYERARDEESTHSRSWSDEMDDMLVRREPGNELLSDVGIDRSKDVQVTEQNVSREQWLEAVRNEHPALVELDNAAMERVLEEANDLGNMRGQLFEELANVALADRAQALGDDCEFIRGGRIHWRGGEELTDGMIVRPSQDEAGYDVVAFAECKAGERAAAGLEESNTRFERLGQQQRSELEGFAIDELRERLGATEQDRQPGNWAHGDELRQSHRQELDALMRELHGADQTGQIRNDFERLMEHATKDDVGENVRARDAVRVLIDGEEARVRVSPADTKVFAVTPGDVSTEEMLERMKKQGIEGESIQLGVTAAEVERLARELQDAQRQFDTD